MIEISFSRLFPIISFGVTWDTISRKRNSFNTIFEQQGRNLRPESRRSDFLPNLTFHFCFPGMCFSKTRKCKQNSKLLLLVNWNEIVIGLELLQPEHHLEFHENWQVQLIGRAPIEIQHTFKNVNYRCNLCCSARRDSIQTFKKMPKNTWCVASHGGSQSDFLSWRTLQKVHTKRNWIITNFAWLV